MTVGVVVWRRGEVNEEREGNGESDVVIPLFFP